MKKTLLLSLLPLLSNFVNAQDICDELAKIYEKSTKEKRTSRVTTIVESSATKMIIEKDTNGHVHSLLMIDMKDKKMRLENLLFDDIMYRKENDAYWNPILLDSLKMKMMKTDGLYNQFQYLKNCEKLPNEKVTGKYYQVYKAVFDAAKMKAALEKDNPQIVREMTTDIKMIIYANDKNDVEIIKMAIDKNGHILESVMNIEYDVKIPKIVPPPPPPPAKTPSKRN